MTYLGSWLGQLDWLICGPHGLSSLISVTWARSHERYRETHTFMLRVTWLVSDAKDTLCQGCQGYLAVKGNITCGWHGGEQSREIGSGMVTGTKTKLWIAEEQGKAWKISDHQADQLQSLGCSSNYMWGQRSQFSTITIRIMQPGIPESQEDEALRYRVILLMWCVYTKEGEHRKPSHHSSSWPE